ncbi:ATP-binding cassette domain-containing protein [Enterococcus lemanii]|uniref:ATP-binding cassette domain-containing protein n=1 Tax=Enterococcus lemanii TaxID=1159752 RepID=A0ABV9MU15_9ENTE|nr:ATP-binding cassette domain-containing protein [Enterococcus lemanii]MBM7708345.1 D-methionine transport system ATP-binding protein [Enterococcus lemanii]
MYRFEQVSQLYDEKLALVDLSFSVSSNEFVGIVGKSGSGKSTLLRLLNLLEAPTRGKLYLENREVATLSAREKQQMKEKIGMVFQQFNLLHNLTVAENIALPLKLSGQKETSVVTSLLTFVGLEQKAHAYPSQLSGGEKQRVALARALVRKPELLLCDEVTSALDEEYADEVLRLLQKIHTEMDVTIFFVSHDLAAVKKTCSRILVMEEGRLLGELSHQPEKLVKESESYFEKVKRRLGQ